MLHLCSGELFLDNGTKNYFGHGNEPSNWDEKEDHNMRL
jgi:hypothetical protein